MAGDARALAVTDLDQDGWPEVFVTRNNDRASWFATRPPAGRKSFAVSLRGPAGNPAAAGAALTLTLADGSVQSVEIAAGSGYFSQSGARAFFGYPEKTSPVRLKIRWPNGGVSEQTFDQPPPKQLRLTVP